MADPISAADVFAAELRRRESGPIHRGGLLLAATLTELTFGLLPKPSLDDLVVTRRDDGRVLLRTPAGPMGDAADLLARTNAVGDPLAGRLRRALGTAAGLGLPPNSGA